MAAKKGKNTHLEHIEDEIINKGAAGGEQAISILKAMGAFLDGKPGPAVAVTTKWDGAPAIVCGTDPSDGRFFIGTKAVFNKVPVMSKSEKEISQNHQGELAQKLSLAFRYLSKANIKGVLQGDMMFMESQKKRENIMGQRYITFRPNTITYAANPSTELGKAIDNARFGIVFHTKYTGSNISNMTASFGVSDSDFNVPPGAWIEKSTFKDISGAASMRIDERRSYEAAIRRAEGSLKKCGAMLDDILSGGKALMIDTELKKFFNSFVVKGEQIPPVKTTYIQFFYHLGEEFDKAISKNKSIAAQADKAVKWIELIDLIMEREEEFMMVLATYMNLQLCKNMLVDKMKKVSELNLFADRGNGDYIATSPEGFVAIQGRTAVKLIDRLEFSKLNFTLPKVWG